jgi:hypothetical protein
VASIVWERFGEVKSYVEPFFGSGAVLLSVPRNGRTETVSDADGMVANFWRSVAKDPDAVAHHADWPVTEQDLHARHLWLVGQRESLTERLCADADFHDAKAAGWWCWGACAWIGSGWCSGSGPWHVGESGLLEKGAKGAAGKGISRKRPHLGDAGQGISRKRPHLGDAGHGINRQLPHLGDAGQGINRQLPHLGNAGQCADRSAFILDWIRRLADRMRDVRVCCGDWERICGDAVLCGVAGVFLDPPYGNAGNGRESDLYAVDSLSVAGRVLEWCKARTTRKDFRICLAGYDGEHNELEAMGWSVVAWKASRGYGAGKGGRGEENRGRERLWFSPACLVPEEKTAAAGDLFAATGGEE